MHKHESTFIAMSQDMMRQLRGGTGDSGGPSLTTTDTGNGTGSDDANATGDSGGPRTRRTGDSGGPRG